ncbi:putative receptor protein kinase ZmPK1 [Hordeum vulgare]|nr:putative receptor protein kinase ZmPK1 [Hordeum vulgare]
MDTLADTPLRPCYTRDPSASVAKAAATAANPSAGSFCFASTGAPSSTGVTRGIFMPPRMTSTAGGLASVPAVNPHAPLLKLPNAVRPKKGKVSSKKNKAVDGSGSSKLSRKKLAGRATVAAATEALTSSLVELAAEAHKVFEEMPQSVNNEAYMSTMGVGSNNSHWFQTNDMHFDDHEFEVDEDAPPGGMGGMSSGVPTPSHDVVEDLANTARDNEEEEEEFSSDDESEEEEKEEEDKDEDEDET